MGKVETMENTLINSYCIDFFFIRIKKLAKNRQELSIDLITISTICWTEKNFARLIFQDFRAKRTNAVLRHLRNLSLRTCSRFSGSSTKNTYRRKFQSEPYRPNFPRRCLPRAAFASPQGNIFFTTQRPEGKNERPACLARLHVHFSRCGVSFPRLIKPSHLVPVNALWLADEVPDDNRSWQARYAAPIRAYGLARASRPLSQHQANAELCRGSEFF